LRRYDEPVGDLAIGKPIDYELSDGELGVYWFGFRDAGRGFQVLVALGRSASPARVAEALALLDSLRFDPGHT
jgi:hypothetical protein